MQPRVSEETNKDVKFIVTHHRPHADEALAIFLLRRYGKEHFPGIDTAQLLFWDSGATAPDGRAASSWEEDGYLLVGIGGGRFDEHVATGDDGKDGECAATLVAREIGVQDAPWLGFLLKFVQENDTIGAGHPFDIAKMAMKIGALVGTGYEGDMKVMEWLWLAFEAEIHAQQDFGSAAEDFQRATIREFPGPTGELIKVAAVESACEQIVNYAISRSGAGMDVVIRRNPANGQVCILRAERSGIKLEDVARSVRYLEQPLLPTGKPLITDFKRLGSNGTLPEIPEWFYRKQGEMLLNGSRSALDKPATKLSLNVLLDSTERALSPDFEPSRATMCAKGVCTSSRNSECPWYCFGLNRCRNIRFVSSQQRK